MAETVDEGLGGAAQKNQGAVKTKVFSFHLETKGRGLFAASNPEVQKTPAIESTVNEWLATNPVILPLTSWTFGGVSAADFVQPFFGRHLLVRHERYAFVFNGFVSLACLITSARTL